jgi:hypothetical protein
MWYFASNIFRGNFYKRCNYFISQIYIYLAEIITIDIQLNLYYEFVKDDTGKGVQVLEDPQTTNCLGFV